MLRYVATAAAVLVLLAIALRTRTAGAPALAVPPGVAPAARVESGPEGRTVTVTHAVRGSVTRASLVYEIEGRDEVAAIDTDCRGGAGGSVTDDGYATAIELTGPLPQGASRLRLVLESETGTETYPLEP